jgi:hypothetical protein
VAESPNPGAGFGPKFKVFLNQNRSPDGCGKRRRHSATFPRNPRRALLKHAINSAKPRAPLKAPEEGVFTMPTGPKDNEEKMQRMLNSWEALAPDKSFGGMTLAQFRAATQPSQAARDRIDDLEEQLRQAQNDRDRADEDFLVKAQLVVAGVLADPTFGPDSALYEGFGYTRKSDRKSGLTRKRKPPQPPTT